ncbi:MAG: glycosyltransferase family 2 protein [Anaerolineaceae bacterium]|jgi:glycosyltransferase involved in cell wall biosynthesis
MQLVSIIIPCYNEQATIRLLLDAIYAQTYPRASLEVIIADGMSTDQTRAAIREFTSSHADLVVRVVDNPRRIIPAALNCALAAAGGEFIIRLDAHSAPAADYVERTIAALQANMGDNVGGLWLIRPGNESWVAKAIAAAAAHPLGVGDARYRYSNRPGIVDTVPFGAFRRDLIERIGPFDESLLANEDYEFNARIRKHHGQIWFDPQIRSMYYARGSLGSLARQYWRYGYWKRRMLERYPETLRWRQALPPVFVLGLIGLLLLAPVWPASLPVLVGVILLYFLILLAASLTAAISGRDLRLLAGIPAAIAVMHLSWGSGFLWSALQRHPRTEKIA